MISDDVFRQELDTILKKRKVCKADRNNLIDKLLQMSVIFRDDVLDYQHDLTADYLKQRDELRHIPTEHAEQSKFVHWFRKQYPDVLIYAIPNGGNRSAREAQSLVLEGVVAGIPDLHIPKWQCWIEFKRIKGGIWSDEQKVMQEYLESIEHEYILAYGFEDAKEKIINFMPNF